MTESMIERVRDAIFKEMDVTDGLDLPAAQRYARAAIEAMREPTDAMWLADGLVDHMHPYGRMGDHDRRRSPMARRISRQGWRAYGGGLILIRREFELAPGCCCGPVIDRSAELNLSIHNAIIHDVNQSAPATLLLEALADWSHPLPIEQLVIP